MATILAIEDDPAFLDLLRLHLLRAGYAVEVAEDPERGLRQILETSPDLILLDLDLPYLSGFELLEALRADPASRNIPVIVITGREDDESHARCQKIGVDGFFTKPLKSEELVRAVGGALAARAGK